MKKLVLLFIFLLGLSTSSFSDNTHGHPDPFQETQSWFGDLASGYIHSGCQVAVPASSLTLGAFACSGYVQGSSSELVYVTQAAATLTLTNVSGVHWLALSRDTSSAVSGWTRRAGSHYLFRQVTAQPANPAGGLVFAKVTVAGGVITAVADFRLPSSYVRSRVFDITDPLYGAIGDDSTDATVAIQAALTAARDQGTSTTGGLVVFVPNGTFKTTAALNIYQYTTLRGNGKRTSLIHAAHTGNGIASTWTINTSNPVYIRLENLSLLGDNGSTGAGFVDLAGAYIDLYQVRIDKFNYGIIFDQTEHGTIDTVEVSSQITAGVWLVNGADRTVGALANFTNRIEISRSQFNEGSAAYGLVDDGGVEHTIRDNNFNGGLRSIRACCNKGITISGNEIEQSISNPITFSATTLAGTTGGSLVRPYGIVLLQNAISSHGGVVHVVFTVADSATLIGNAFGSDNTAAARVSFVDIVHVTSLENFFIGGPSNGGTYTGSPTGFYIIFDAQNNSRNAIFYPGINLPYAGVTPSTGMVTGNNLNNYEEGTFVPTLVSAGATFNYATNGQVGLYTRIGRMVFFHIYLELATSGNTLTAGAMTITGLPFVSLNVTNAFAQAAVIQWANITTSVTSLNARVNVATATIRLDKITAAAVTSINAMASNDLHATNGSILIISGSYTAAL